MNREVLNRFLESLVFSERCAALTGEQLFEAVYLLRDDRAPQQAETDAVYEELAVRLAELDGLRAGLTAQGGNHDSAQ